MSGEDNGSEPRIPVDNSTEPRGLVYESNPKHSEPWQRGQRGSICESEVRELAQELLRDSVQVESKRYAVHDEKAYCAQEHRPGRWHGYPVGWREVPPKLVIQWKKEKLVDKRARKKFWEGH